MAKITTAQFLPPVFRTPTNEQFLGATLDQIVDQPQVERVQGYIGSPLGSGATADQYYIPEPSRTRRDYQLEPGVVFTAAESSRAVDTITYPEMIGALDTAGAVTDRHDRLWTAQYWAWDSLVNLDMLINYNQYYWLPDGPSAVSITQSSTLIVTDIIGRAAYTSANGVVFTNGLKVLMPADTTPTTYANNEYYVEGVGTAIRLVAVKDLVAPEVFTQDIYIPWDVRPWDTTVWDTRLYVPLFRDYITINRGSRDLNGWTRSNMWFHIDVLRATAQYNGTPHYVDTVATIDSKAQRPIIEFYPDMRLYNSGIRGLRPCDYIDTRAVNAGSEVAGQSVYYPDVEVSTVNYPAGTATLGASTTAGGVTTTLITVPGADITGVFKLNQYIGDSSGVLPRDARIVGVDTVGAVTLITAAWTSATVIAAPVASVSLIAATDSLGQYQLFDGARIIFAADTDPAVRGRVWVANLSPVAGGGRVFTLTPATDGGNVGDSQTVILRGFNYYGKNFRWNGSNWIPAQQKTAINQEPLFDLFNSSGVSLGDGGVYPDTTFRGCTLFQYARGSGPNDPVLGFPLQYNSAETVGDIVFAVSLNSDVYTYTDGGVTTSAPVNSGLVHDYNSDTTYERRMGWVTGRSTLPQYQWVSRVYRSGDTRALTIDAPAGGGGTPPAVVLVLNGSVQEESTYTVTTTATTTTVSWTDSGGSVVAALGVLSTTASTDGYYGVPLNLSNNPLNGDPTTAAVGDIRRYYASIWGSAPGTVGPALGANNYRDLASPISWGTAIIKNTSSVLLPGSLLRNPQHDLSAAILWTGQQYEAWKVLLLNTVFNGNYNTPPSGRQLLDDALQHIAESRDQGESFFWTDQLPSGQPYATGVYTFRSTLDSTTYPLSRVYDYTTASYVGLLVYRSTTINGVAVTQQLLRGREYTVSTTAPEVTVTVTLVPGDTITVYEYNQTWGTYAPSTPQKLGILPAVEPAVYTDTTPVSWIIGHDGSYTRLWGEYNTATRVFTDMRDSALWEYECRVWNNLKVDGVRGIDSWTVQPGYWREAGGVNAYTYSEWMRMYTPPFLDWIGTNNLAEWTRQTYSEDDQFTWNYRDAGNKLTGQPVEQGYWRGIYLYLYDTTRPHTHPWELLHYTSKPSWWDGYYGTGPYTSDNTVLWEDLARGYDYRGGSPRTIAAAVRPGLLQVLPVDSAGNLVSPFNAWVGNYTVDYRVNRAFRNTWVPGDIAPTEWAYRTSSSWSFHLARIIALQQPANFYNLYANTDHYRWSSEWNNWVWDGRPGLNPRDIPLYGTGTPATSYLNWIIDWEKSRGRSATTDLHAWFNRLDVRLVYRAASYTDKRLLQLFVERSSPGSSTSSLLISDSSYQILLHRGVPHQSLQYSSVVVQTTGGGYRVDGYSTATATFPTLVPYIDGAYEVVTVGRITARLPQNWSTTIAWVPYGTSMGTVYDVALFLAGYGRYLQSRGMVFETVENGIEVNWSQMVAEFLYWAQSGWGVGSLITLNPAAKVLQVTPALGVVEPTGNGGASYVLNQNLYPLDRERTAIVRSGSTYRLSPLQDGDTVAYGIFRYTAWEHAVVFDNTTQFGDPIYNPLTGSRQGRIALRGSRTADWRGTISTPGFVLNSDDIAEWNRNTVYPPGEIVRYKGRYWTARELIQAGREFDQSVWVLTDWENFRKGLLPNSSTTSVESTLYYDANRANLEDDPNLLAFSLIGFRPREYTQQADLTDTTQVGVYSQLIRYKGTPRAAGLFRGSVVGGSALDYTVYENWMIQSATWGGVLNSNWVEWAITGAAATGDPTIFQLVAGTDGVYDSSNVNQVVQISDLINWGRQPTGPQLLRASTSLQSQLFASAGYGNYSDMRAIAVDWAALQAQQSATLPQTYVGDAIWIAALRGTWRVLTPLAAGWQPYPRAPRVVVTTVYNGGNGTATVLTSGNHNLQVYDAVAIVSFNIAVNGYYIVAEVIDPTTFVIGATLPPEAKTLTGTGVLLRTVDRRVGTVVGLTDDLVNTPFIPTRAWVDTWSDGRWAVVERKNRWQLSTQTSVGGGVAFGVSVGAIDGAGGLVGDSGTSTLRRYSADGVLIQTITGAAGFGSLIAGSGQLWSVGNSTGNSVTTYIVSDTAVSGTAVGTTLTVTGVVGTIVVGRVIGGTGLQSNTSILAQISGTPGGVGVYTLSQSASADSSGSWIVYNPLTQAAQITPPRVDSLGTSADGRWLYVGDTAAGVIRAYTGGAQFTAATRGAVIQGVVDGTTLSVNAVGSGVVAVGDYVTGYQNLALSSTLLVAGTTYTITSVGTTNWVSIGAASNTWGVIFVATGSAAGTGSASPTVPAGTRITALGTGTGGIGTYTLSTSSNIGSGLYTIQSVVIDVTAVSSGRINSTATPSPTLGGGPVTSGTQILDPALFPDPLDPPFTGTGGLGSYKLSTPQYWTSTSVVCGDWALVATLGSAGWLIPPTAAAGFPASIHSDSRGTVLHAGAPLATVGGVTGSGRGYTWRRLYQQFEVTVAGPQTFTLQWSDTTTTVQVDLNGLPLTTNYTVAAATLTVTAALVVGDILDVWSTSTWIPAAMFESTTPQIGSGWGTAVGSNRTGCSVVWGVPEEVDSLGNGGAAYHYIDTGRQWGSITATAPALLNATRTVLLNGRSVQLNGAVVTGDIQGAIFTGFIRGCTWVGSIAGTVLTITSITNGIVQTGSTVTGTGVPLGTTVTGQLTGTPGGVGTYSVSIAGAVASTVMVGTGTTLTVTALTSGTITVGQTISGVGITPGTIITALATGTGGLGTYTVSVYHYTVSTLITGSGTTLTVTGYTSGRLVVGSVLSTGATITALGTGTGGIGTYTVTPAQLIASTTITAASTPGWVASNIAADIIQAAIPNVTATATGGVLTISLVDVSLGIPGNLLNVGITAYTTLAELGLSYYTAAGGLQSPTSDRTTSFGAAISWNMLDVLAIGAPRDTAVISTTFDLSGDETSLNDTVFDNGATRWLDSSADCGSVYLYERLSPYASTTLTPPVLVYSATITPSGVGTSAVGGAQPLWGSTVQLGVTALAIGSSRWTSTTPVGTGAATLYVNASGLTNWTVVRRSLPIADVDSIGDVQVYDTTTNITAQYWDRIDPLYGRLLGVVHENLDYISDSDPAGYNSAPTASSGDAGKIVWGSNYDGVLWFDTSRVMWPDYRAGDLSYAARNWGTIFPGSTPLVYTWVSSSVPPSNWSGPGVPRDTDLFAVHWVENSGGALQPIYSFWVRGTDIPQTQRGKTLSDTVLEAYIGAPQSAGIPFLMPLTRNTVGLTNLASVVAGGNQWAVHLGYSTGTSGDPQHVEYTLIRSGNPDDFLPGLPTASSNPADLYLKWIDSFSGIDTTGASVPDTSLPPLLRWGVSVRPRQSLFRDRNLALQNYIEWANAILKRYPAREMVEPLFLQKSGVESYTVDATSLQRGRTYTIVVVGTTNWLSVGATSSTIGTTFTATGAGTGTGTAAPHYDVTQYWEYSDWWATGYSSATKISTAVNFYYELETLDPLEGQVVRVNSGSITEAETYRFTTATGWTRIGVERGTIQFLSTLWNKDYSPTPQLETRWIIRALAEQIWVDDLLLFRNEGLILMFDYITSEAPGGGNYLPWLNKTSLIDVAHTAATLDDRGSYRNDNATFLEGYIKEALPYHVVLKEFTLRYGVKDAYAFDATDFDLPSEWRQNLNTYITPQLVFNTAMGDSEYLNTDAIWNQLQYINWTNNWGMELGGTPAWNAAVLVQPLYVNSTTVTVSNAIGLPPSGYITVDSEAILYSSVNRLSGVLSGISRGQLNTTVTDHAVGTAVLIDLPAATIIQSGRGYVSAPSVAVYIDTSVYSPPRTVATAAAATTLGAVTAVTTTPGSGYVVTPQIRIDPSVVYTVVPAAISTVTGAITVGSNILQTGDIIVWSGDTGYTPPAGLLDSGRYYVGVLSSTTIGLYRSLADAAVDEDRIVPTTAGAGNQYINFGALAQFGGGSSLVREPKIGLGYDRVTYTSTPQWVSSAVYGAVYPSQYSTAVRPAVKVLSVSGTNPAVLTIDTGWSAGLVTAGQLDRQPFLYTTNSPTGLQGVAFLKAVGANTLEAYLDYDLTYGIPASQFAAPIHRSGTATIAGSTTTFTGWIGDDVITGSISGTTLTVTASLNSALAPGLTLSGSGLVPGTTIVGGTGGVGVYTVRPAQTLASTTLYAGGTTLTVLAVGTGTINPGDVITAPGTAPQTTVLSQSTGAPGGAGTYVVSTSQLVGSPVGTVAFQNITSSLTLAAPILVTGYIDNGLGPGYTGVAGAILTVTGVTSGTLFVGAPLYGTGIAPYTYILSFATGLGGTGTYVVGTPQAVPSTTIASTQNLQLGTPLTVVPVTQIVGSIGASVLQVTVATPGSIVAGYTLIASGILPNTTIQYQLTPLVTGEVVGGIGRYLVSNSQIVASTVMQIQATDQLNLFDTYRVGSIVGNTVTLSGVLPQFTTAASVNLEWGPGYIFSLTPLSNPASRVLYSGALWECQVGNGDAVFDFSKWKQVSMYAPDRIVTQYKPTANMPGVDLTQLMLGVTNPLATYSGGPFAPNYTPDTIITDPDWSRPPGTTVNTIVGAAFDTGYGPEEMVPGIVKDLACITVISNDAVLSFRVTVDSSGASLVHNINPYTQTTLLAAHTRVSDTSDVLQVADVTKIVELDVRNNPADLELTSNASGECIVTGVQVSKILQVSVSAGTVQPISDSQIRITGLPPNTAFAVSVTFAYGNLVYIDKEFIGFTLCDVDVITAVSPTAAVLGGLRRGLLNSRINTTIAIGTIVQSVLSRDALPTAPQNLSANWWYGKPSDTAVSNTTLATNTSPAALILQRVV